MVCVGRGVHPLAIGGTHGSRRHAWGVAHARFARCRVPFRAENGTTGPGPGRKSFVFNGFGPALDFRPGPAQILGVDGDAAYSLEQPDDPLDGDGDTV